MPRVGPWDSPLASTANRNLEVGCFALGNVFPARPTGAPFVLRLHDFCSLQRKMAQVSKTRRQVAQDVRRGWAVQARHRPGCAARLSAPRCRNQRRQG